MFNAKAYGHYPIDSEGPTLAELSEGDSGGRYHYESVDMGVKVSHALLPTTFSRIPKMESNGKSIFHAYWKENRQYDDNCPRFIVK